MRLEDYYAESDYLVQLKEKEIEDEMKKMNRKEMKKEVINKKKKENELKEQAMEFVMLFQISLKDELSDVENGDEDVQGDEGDEDE
ncbi:MAG: hypothetical protein EZS28_006428 [Streblomastix strix]|uniref:Uncharacterized protein n=1 Tax=Streblomastix strix TaxID=222440 RepID=A0A5J4WU06_9EUKA|nr:MAG: hypothetical protein EZS28_006428 [Streblomastix strix]